MVKSGDRAPDFVLPDADMHLRSLADFRDRILVLYFYPRDDTPGCTLQANEFSDLLPRFSRLGARVVGVSQDDCFTHQAFRDKHGLKIMLLADVDGEACEGYGVLREREKNGVKHVGIMRSTFVIDRAQTVRFARYGVAPGRHAHEMLQVVKDLRSR